MPRTEETERFIEYVKLRYKNFDDKTFFLSDNYIINNEKSVAVIKFKDRDIDIVKDIGNVDYDATNIDYVSGNSSSSNSTFYTIKRFLIETFIILTPSFISIFIISIVLLGCYDGSESLYSSHDLNNVNNVDNVVASLPSVDQNDDSTLIKPIDLEAVDNLQNKNQNQNHNIESDNSIKCIKICTSVVVIIAAFMLFSYIFPQDVISVLQRGLSEGPYSPDSLKTTEDILSEIAHRRSV